MVAMCIVHKYVENEKKKLYILMCWIYLFVLKVLICEWYPYVVMGLASSRRNYATYIYLPINFANADL